MDHTPMTVFSPLWISCVCAVLCHVSGIPFNVLDSSISRRDPFDNSRGGKHIVRFQDLAGETTDQIQNDDAAGGMVYSFQSDPSKFNNVPSAYEQNSGAGAAGFGYQGGGFGQQASGYSQQFAGYAQNGGGYAQAANAYAQQANNYAHQAGGYGQQDVSYGRQGNNYASQGYGYGAQPSQGISADQESPYDARQASLFTGSSPSFWSGYGESAASSAYPGLSGQAASTGGYQGNTEFNTINAQPGYPHSNYYGGNGVAGSTGFQYNPATNQAGFANSAGSQNYNTANNANTYSGYSSPAAHARQAPYTPSSGYGGFNVNSGYQNNAGYYSAQAGARQAPIGGFRNFYPQFNRYPAQNNIPAPTRPPASHLLAHLALGNGPVRDAKLRDLQRSAASNHDSVVFIGQYDQSRGGGDLQSVNEYLYGEGVVFKK